MRAGFITYSLEIGGAEKNLIELIHFLQKSDLQADIISIKKINDYPTYSKDISIFYLLKRGQKYPLFLFPIVLPIVLLRFFFLFLRRDYDMLIGSIEYQSYYLAVFFAKILSLKSVLIIISPLAEEMKRKFFVKRVLSKLFFTLSAKACDRIICVSNGVANELKQTFGITSKKITVIYNGVNVHSIRQYKDSFLPKAFPFSPQRHDIIINCSRYVKMKGLHKLLYVFGKIKKKHHKAKLVLIGSGPMKKDLYKCITNLGLNKDVYLTGFVENPFPYFNTAKLFLLTSEYEGFGNVLVEAMACGLPVISTDCPYGPREILSSKKELLYHPDLVKRASFRTYGILIPTITGFHLEKNKLFHKKHIWATTVIKLLKNKKMMKKYRQKSLQRANDFQIHIMHLSYLKYLKKTICSSN